MHVYALSKSGITQLDSTFTLLFNVCVRRDDLTLLLLAKYSLYNSNHTIFTHEVNFSLQNRLRTYLQVALPLICCRRTHTGIRLPFLALI